MTELFRLVVAFDGSAEARRALHAAFDLADGLGAKAEVHVVSVVDYVLLPTSLGAAPVGAPDLLASDAETELRVADEIASFKRRQITTHMLTGPVAGEVLKFARSIGARFIVVGTHGRKGIARAVLGSTCERLVRESEIPVLTVRALPQADKRSPVEQGTETVSL